MRCSRSRFLGDPDGSIIEPTRGSDWFDTAQQESDDVHRVEVGSYWCQATAVTLHGVRAYG